MEWLPQLPTLVWAAIGLFGVLLLVFLPSLRIIGADQVGLVIKRFSLKRLQSDDPIAFNGEAGYQADLLMPGWYWTYFWFVYKVEKHPWVQVPAGGIGVVIAQIGQPLPTGAKSGIYKKEFADFSNLKAFIDNGGQKGVQRPCLPPGALVPIHPVAFLVVTRDHVYGTPVSEYESKDGLSCKTFGLSPEQLNVKVIQAKPKGDGKVQDICGIVTALEGPPLPSGALASRQGGYADVEALEKSGAGDLDIIELLLGNKNAQHNNYQDFQGFLDGGGCIGMQHDCLLYGAYNLNPFLVQVEETPMLTIKQGEVAVIKGYVGLATVDTSGASFKFGSIVRPGHRGIWQEPLRTGKYAINPRCYEAELVSTCILTLNWAEAVSQAHNLDAGLKQIVAKSNEGFVFKIDLQVQIHVPDTKAPRVISMVGTMHNLVNEVLQAAVGNHFRDRLQSMPAIKFIETRQEVQESAMQHISTQLNQYEVETRGVYIQDVILPQELVQVLTQREIANQEIATYQMQEKAEQQRVSMEAAKGTANMQKDLAQSKVGIEIKKNDAEARIAQGRGEAEFISQTGKARGAEIESVGMATARSLQAQREAVGPQNAAIVNIVKALSDGKMQIVPQILSMGGNGGSLDNLAGVVMKYLGSGDNNQAAALTSSEAPAPAPAAPESEQVQ